jgi:hypothetical protein
MNAGRMHRPVGCSQCYHEVVGKNNSTGSRWALEYLGRKESNEPAEAKLLAPKSREWLVLTRGGCGVMTWLAPCQDLELVRCRVNN